MNFSEIKHTENSETISSQNGFCEVRISSVRKYAKFAVDNFHGKSNFVFRGQENSEWLLQSSFQRLAKGKNPAQTDLERHLRNFKAASRGRRGTNPQELTEGGWWTLGQHYGLATPLLDWTRSHWVALYFAFYKATESKSRSVYAADLSALHKKSSSKKSSSKDWDQVEIVDPDVHGNPRLISQSGILLKLLIHQNLEEWVQNKFFGYDRVVLIKMNIPNEDVNYCIRDLNRMNINNMTLFPDLVGASGFANAAELLSNLVFSKLNQAAA